MERDLKREGAPMYVFKHLLALIILSIIFVLALPYAHHAATWYLAGHDWIANHLKEVMSGGRYIDLARQLIALLIFPLLAGTIPAIFYWLIRRQWLPAFLAIVWTVWLLQIGILAMSVSHASLSPNEQTTTVTEPSNTEAPASNTQ